MTVRAATVAQAAPATPSAGAPKCPKISTQLTTALNTSFFAERVAYFSIVMGIALLLTGIGFLVLTLGGALGWVALPAREKKLNTASAAT